MHEQTPKKPSLVKRLGMGFLAAAAIVTPVAYTGYQIASGLAESTASVSTVQTQEATSRDGNTTTAHIQLTGAFNRDPAPDWIKVGKCRSNAAIKGGVICPPSRSYPGSIPPNWRDYPPF